MASLLSTLLKQHTPPLPLLHSTPPTFPPAASRSDEPAIPDPRVFTITPLAHTSLPHTAATSPPPPPSVSQCAVHLELLQALGRLKHRVVKEAALIEVFGTVDEERETWWAAFVEVAVGRFEAWWWGVEEELRRREEEEAAAAAGKGERDRDRDKDKETAAAESAQVRELPPDLLPPLDVLMVWHAYLLNPRRYSEDALHHGLHRIQHTAFPWPHIHAATSTDTSAYALPDAAARFFERLTSQSPRLLDELLWKDAAPHRPLRCPACAAQAPPVPICDWMDAAFSAVCPACGRTIDKEALCAEKLRAEIAAFLAKGPGGRMRMTNLDGQGRAPGDPHSTAADREAADFVNGLFRRAFTGASLTASDSFGALSARLHAGIEGEDEATPARLAALEAVLGAFAATPRAFSLNLTGAVLRQGAFVAKMNDRLWLRSPALVGRLPLDAGGGGGGGVRARARLGPARACVLVADDGGGFLKRAVGRYERFFALFARHPGRTLVPTLDVDLVWHSAMLTAGAYRCWCRVVARRFVDHDDALGPGTLDAAFEFTAGAYEGAFGEVYGRCCCWYCEAARSEGLEPEEEGGGRTRKGGAVARLWRGRAEARRERAVRVTVEFYKEAERRRRAGEAGLAWGGLWEALRRA